MRPSPVAKVGTVTSGPASTSVGLICANASGTRSYGMPRRLWGQLASGWGEGRRDTHARSSLLRSTKKLWLVCWSRCSTCATSSYSLYCGAAIVVVVGVAETRRCINAGFILPRCPVAAACRAAGWPKRALARPRPIIRRVPVHKQSSRVHYSQSFASTPSPRPLSLTKIARKSSDAEYRGGAGIATGRRFFLVEVVSPSREARRYTKT